MSQKGPWTTPKRFKRSSSSASSHAKKSWSSGNRRMMVSAWRNPAGRAMAWHGSPFGRSMRTQLTFGENVRISSTAGVPGSYLFSINSLWDPNVTGTGGQPRFFDTLCGTNDGTAPYNRYRVYGSKIEVICLPGGEETDAITMRGAFGIGLYNTSATGPSTLAELLARSDYVTKFLGYWSGGTDHVKISRRCDLAQFFDVKDITAQPELSAAYNASPALSGRWALTWVPANESATRDVRVFVKITYDVEFFNRNDVADS